MNTLPAVLSGYAKSLLKHVILGKEIAPVPINDLYSLILSDQIEHDMRRQQEIALKERKIAEQQRKIAGQQREIANQRSSVMVLQIWEWWSDQQKAVLITVPERSLFLS